MKSKNLVFYAVAVFSLCLFMILPLAGGLSLAENIPGYELCLEWIKAGERFVISRN